jgi:hypothetical protein
MPGLTILPDLCLARPGAPGRPEPEAGPAPGRSERVYVGDGGGSVACGCSRGGHRAKAWVFLCAWSG